MCDRFKVLCDLMVMYLGYYIHYLYLVSHKKGKKFDLPQNKRLSFNNQIFFISMENILTWILRPVCSNPIRIDRDTSISIFIILPILGY